MLKLGTRPSSSQYTKKTGMSRYFLFVLVVLVAVSVIADAHRTQRLHRPARRGRVPGVAWRVRQFMRNCVGDAHIDEEEDNFDDLDDEEDIEVGELTPLTTDEIEPEPVGNTEEVNPRRRMRLQRRQQRQNRRLARRRGRGRARFSRRMGARQQRQQRRQERRQRRRSRWCDKLARFNCTLPNELSHFCDENVPATSAPVVL